MVLLRFWTTDISPERSQDVLGHYADVLTAILDDSSQTVAKLDNPDDFTHSLSHDEPTKLAASTEIAKDLDAKPEVVSKETVPSTLGSLVSGLQADPNLLRQIVKECVQEIVGQMFQSGDLVGYKHTANEAIKQFEGALDQPAAKKTFKKPKGQHKIELDVAPKDFGSKLGPKGQEETKQTPVKKFSPAELILGTLRSLWRHGLETPETSIDDEDTFFGLGGDSMRAMNLVGIAREKNLEMRVGDVFNASSLAELATLAEPLMKKQGDKVGNAAADTTNLPATPRKLDSTPYRPFSLLKTSNVESFIQNQVCPRTDVFRGGILDVYPATDFQAFAIAGSFVDARWMLNYFYLDGNGPLDILRLKKSARQLVEAYDILRTVFIPHQDRYLQVVLRKAPPQLQVLATDQELDEYCREMREQDRDARPRLGDTYTRFAVVKKSNSNQHRIILRLSHAQYDGVSMPAILSAFQAVHEGKAVPSSPTFSAYVSSATKTGGYEYWRKLLQGSSMTEIVRRDQPCYNPSDSPMEIFKRTISLPSMASHNIQLRLF